jgi:hypothetical protein
LCETPDWELSPPDPRSLCPLFSIEFVEFSPSSQKKIPGTPVLAISAFPPGQVLKEYCRTEATGDVTGVLSCTAAGKKQQNLLF